MKDLNIKKGLILFGTVLILAIIGCAHGLEKEQEWKEGQGELPNQIGEESQADQTETDVIIPPLFMENEALWQEAGYEAPTGKWFFHNGEGFFGYGLTSGIQKAGDEFIVSLIDHESHGSFLERDVRIQLIEQTGHDAQQKEPVLEEIIHVEKVTENQTIYSGQLPDQENISYILSAEILSNEGQVEDTRISLIYVPKQELNASLHTDKSTYSASDQETTLILKNYGPTILFHGTYYTLEKKIDDGWRIVPLDTAFEDIGYFLAIGEQYEQSVDISQLNPGEYRLIKEIQAEGLDLGAVLAASFTIE